MNFISKYFDISQNRPERSERRYDISMENETALPQVPVLDDEAMVALAAEFGLDLDPTSEVRLPVPSGTVRPVAF
jgi:hypothetical protein